MIWKKAYLKKWKKRRWKEYLEKIEKICLRSEKYWLSNIIASGLKKSLIRLAQILKMWSIIFDTVFHILKEKLQAYKDQVRVFLH